jgi:hypothetical protein
MMETEEISETLGFNSTLTCLMAWEDLSTILYTEFVAIMIYLCTA